MYDEKPKRKNDNIADKRGKTHLIEWTIIMMIIVLIIMMILTLLGPSVGNIFSNVTSCACLRP